MATPTDTRVWLITGATSGFGQALAHEAIAAGDVVVGAGRNRTRLDELATDAPGQFHPVVLDVTDTEADRRAVDATPFDQQPPRFARRGRGVPHQRD